MCDVSSCISYSEEIKNLIICDVDDLAIIHEHSPILIKLLSNRPIVLYFRTLFYCNTLVSSRITKLEENIIIGITLLLLILCGNSNWRIKNSLQFSGHQSSNN